MQKVNQKESRVAKVIKRKANKLYAKWKGYGSSFNSWIDKIDIIYISEFFPKLKSSEGRVKAKLNLSNYATKANQAKKKKTGIILQ